MMSRKTKNVEINDESESESGEIVVLTGASGCIGYHTLSLIIDQDDSVREIRCYDLRPPSDGARSSIESQLEAKNKKLIESEKTEAANLDQFKKKKVTWIQGDIRDLNLIEKTLEGADCVIHAAAKIDAWTHWEDQDTDELYSVNVEGTEILLKAAQRLGVYKFIHVSSFETYVGYDTIYYATENTLPENKNFLFGASGSTKWEAEHKVKQYANVKLNVIKKDDTEKSKKPDQLLAVIVRFSTVYGEYDNHYVTKIMELAKFFNGRLQRMTNVWIRQQSIYARNAAWSLIRAKQQLDIDQSISGEEFHITDDTDIADPYDFVEPYLESQGMIVTKDSYPFIPVWVLLWLTFTMARFFSQFDVLGLFTSNKSRYQEAVERDNKNARQHQSSSDNQQTRLRWYHYVMPQTLWFMCNSSFLNRTKASLRLNYEPIVTPEEAHQRSLTWYKNELRI